MAKSNRPATRSPKKTPAKKAAIKQDHSEDNITKPKKGTATTAKKKAAAKKAPGKKASVKTKTVASLKAKKQPADYKDAGIIKTVKLKIAAAARNLASKIRNDAPENTTSEKVDE